MNNIIIETLGLDKDFFERWENSEKELLHQIARKVRYFCFAIQRDEIKLAPKKLKDYYEKQKWFSGWELFADRWDINRENPLEVYPRKFSIHEEWDATLRLAVPELPGVKAYKQTQ